MKPSITYLVLVWIPGQIFGFCPKFWFDAHVHFPYHVTSIEKQTVIKITTTISMIRTISNLKSSGTFLTMSCKTIHLPCNGLVIVIATTYQFHIQHHKHSTVTIATFCTSCARQRLHKISWCSNVRPQGWGRARRQYVRWWLVSAAGVPHRRSLNTVTRWSTRIPRIFLTCFISLSCWNSTYFE